MLSSKSSTPLPSAQGLTPKPLPIRLNNPYFLASFFMLWGLALWWVPNTLTELWDYSAFVLLGMVGAIFANATGAGGGVVFIPMFDQLGFTEWQAVATSFGIQCFGMTAGAVTWHHYYRHETQHLRSWQSFTAIVLLCSLASVIGIWSVYAGDIHAPADLHEIFSWFSIALGLSILASMALQKQGAVLGRMAWFDVGIILLIGWSGGLITAWLSVGVGEILAIYLILRRFDVTMAVAAAVVVSAITVWSAAPQHFWLQPNAYWQVILFAGPGAILGGVFAKTLVTWLSARRLKIFFACWVLFVGVCTSPLLAWL